MNLSLRRCEAVYEKQGSNGIVRGDTGCSRILLSRRRSVKASAPNPTRFFVGPARPELRRRCGFTERAGLAIVRTHSQYGASGLARAASQGRRYSEAYSKVGLSRWDQERS